ncbi:glutathione S-transferase C-terminal domain-containing protein [Nonomuraea mangrovi]|uniref:Glutathione S-transferase C-terminal domain-containing protein n=1 Tax=Nonomuraea mangrovi TaxID=2316207 RepID=A0ABW4T5E4_9ACTN
MTAPTDTPAYASPVDLDAYGPYGPGRAHTSAGWNRPIYPFQGRIGSREHPAEAGRYHLYVSWVCPYAHRAVIVRRLKGLEDVISLSYVDDERDGRGWAFRERRGPDPVNGFTFLEQAYEATEKGYLGHISVPVLWDRTLGRIVSNHYPDITIDLATQWSSGVDLYPPDLRPEIDAINSGLDRRPAPETLERLDRRLGDRRHLFGDVITESDVRLWVHLVRLADLSAYPNLSAYARDLHQHPAFADTFEDGR